MRAFWQTLREELIRTMTSHSTHTAFTEMRGRHAVLAPFADPVSLIDRLNDQSGDAALKDRLLAALVNEAQAHRECTIAASLIHLALWPGLDAIWRRRLRDYPGEAEALASEISARLLEGIARLDLGRVSRIAATLVRNIDRDVGRVLARERDLWRSRVGPEVLEELPDPAFDLEGRQLAMNDGAAFRAIAALETLIGADAGLVRDVVLRGMSRREAGALRGLSAEASRKRYQRAIAAVRCHHGLTVPA